MFGENLEKLRADIEEHGFRENFGVGLEEFGVGLKFRI